MATIVKRYDVHFSLSGFIKIEAECEVAAQDKAEHMLADMKPYVDNVIRTGVAIEIGDAYEE